MINKTMKILLSQITDKIVWLNEAILKNQTRTIAVTVLAMLLAMILFL